MSETKTRTRARDELVIFDLESGGLEPHHPNIQIAAVAVDLSVRGWPVIEEFERKIDFDPDLCEAEALELNHYDPQIWWVEAAPPEIVLNDFKAFLRRHQTLTLTGRKGRPYDTTKIGGHNVTNFDLPRLKRWWGDGYNPFAFWRALDTQNLASWAFDCDYFGRTVKPENVKLGTLCEFFGIEVEGAHDALVDVKATAKLARALLHYMAFNEEDLV